jgi:tetratricopeptide (TPR) repeat protein
MKCLICHLEIKPSEEYYRCQNEHPAHSDCLKEWFKHSKKCPLCRDAYNKSIVKKFESYLSREEDKVREELIKQQKEREIQKIKAIGEKMVFLKFIKTVENLITLEKFEEALEILKTIDSDISTDNGQMIIFLKGKINYLHGRYDLAINYLFKLVKKKFDFPQAFFYLGKSYEKLGLDEKAKWAFERVPEGESSI